LVSLALVPLAGCKTWEPATVSPAQVVREQAPESVRITSSDGTLVTLKAPLLRNDSIVAAGFAGVGVASSEAQSIEVARFSLLKTVALAAAGVAAGATWASATAGNSAGGDDGGQLPKLTFSLSGGLTLLAGIFR
jgi:hypothetical protein